MTVEFRCSRCGRFMRVEADAAPTVRCSWCRARVEVPRTLASLPRPRVAPGEGTEPAPVRPRRDDALTATMSRLMPWVLSLLLHVGVLVILGFITMVVVGPGAQPTVASPQTQLLAPRGGVLRPGNEDTETLVRSLRPADTKIWGDRDAKIPLDDAGRTENPVQVIAIAGGEQGGGGAGEFGLWRGGKGKFRSRFFDVDGGGGKKDKEDVFHVVYLVDRSGSMLDTFDEVRGEMIRSLSWLGAKQTFHVIFFSEGKPKENPPRRLVFANTHTKLEAVKYLKTITPRGRTEVLPALKRAFEVLRRAPNRKGGKVIYLLTDGEFSDNESVVQAIRKMNARREIRVHTILHHHRSREAVNVLRRIADENGGTFKFVGPGETGSAAGAAFPTLCLPAPAVPSFRAGGRKGVEPWL